jgi:hypothetical protein
MKQRWAQQNKQHAMAITGKASVVYALLAHYTQLIDDHL